MGYHGPLECGWMASAGLATGIKSSFGARLRCMQAARQTNVANYQAGQWVIAVNYVLIPGLILAIPD